MMRRVNGPAHLREYLPNICYVITNKDKMTAPGAIFPVAHTLYDFLKKIAKRQICIGKGVPAFIHLFKSLKTFL